MNADSIARMLNQDLSSGVPFDNAHGITPETMNQHLVNAPVIRQFESAGIPDGVAFVDAWIVLDECPDSHDEGYLVVFYPPKSMYGLAVKASPHPIFLGCYGSLSETLTAM